MYTGKTASGFEFSIDEEARDDMELLEAITKLDAGEKNLLPTVISSLLGAEQKERLYDHCRGESGRVSATKVFKEIASIFNEIQNSGDEALKN